MAADPAGLVSLREITANTVRAICSLDVASDQRDLVAPNALSIAEAYFEPAAWFRGIYVGDTPVGFVMLYDPTRTSAPEDGPAVCYLWRFMVDHHHQRRGYGAAALALVVDHVRTLRGVSTLRTSFVPASGNASPLYERAGFRPTGEIDDGETVLELLLAPR